MKRLYPGIFLVLLWTFSVTAQTGEAWQYLDPKPGAEYVNKETAIAIRQGEQLLAENNPANLIEVSGSVSGEHAGSAVFSTDQKTVIFRPGVPFVPGEKVTVSVAPGLRTIGGQMIEGVTWEFVVSENAHPLSVPSFLELHPELEAASKSAVENTLADTLGFQLPESFPALTITENDNPDSGYIYLTSFIGSPNYLMILENSGMPVFFREALSSAIDFKLQPAGVYSYFETDAFHVMDTTFTLFDTYQTGNGYDTDNHEFHLLENGNSLLMSYDPQQVDMSQIVPGGDSNATVIGLIVQELDPGRNVILQWRSWDHYLITDALGQDLTASTIDYVHGNAIAIDVDDNLLISSRNMEEVTKIDRLTADVIWRLNGKNSDFTFTGIDTTKFSYMHGVRVLENGNITLFDNGNRHTPTFSRAMEYAVDTTTWTAELVWQYRENPDLFGPFLGYAQRLSNGNTLIGWGATTPAATEVRPDSGKAFEIAFSPGVFSYRAFRLPSPGVAPEPFLWSHVTENNEFVLNFMKFGDQDVGYFRIYQGTSQNPTTLVDSTAENWIQISGLVPSTTYYFRVTAVNGQGQESPFSNEILYIPVPTGIDEVVVGIPKEHRLFQNYPNPFNPATTIRFGIKEPSYVTLAVYNVLGQKVRTLVSGRQSPGYKTVSWDGKNDAGRFVGTGIYVYRLQAGNTVHSKKMLFLK